MPRIYFTVESEGGRISDFMAQMYTAIYIWQENPYYAK